jgi:hypothetical protein
MAKSSSTLKGTNKFSCFGKSAERSSRNNTSIYNDLRGMGLLAGLIFSCFGNGAERISCAGRGLQPRPPLRGGNVLRLQRMQDLTLRPGLQTPSRGAQFFFCAGRVLQPRPPLRGGNVLRLQQRERNSATFNVTPAERGTGLQTPSGTGGCKLRPAQLRDV